MTGLDEPVSVCISFCVCVYVCWCGVCFGLNELRLLSRALPCDDDDNAGREVKE